ncbi:alpha/beta-hydrolase [Rickenella mellea]|uniref:Alpha/beta-hydrolase n=1 Tax=Rickenella mellea TaxID=50990 RepID=A0A4Y7Q1G7_9AGAM|nr:alpha/beta-hydrolase [Rickenella mellea]
MSVTSESFIFDPRPNYPFLVTAKRYRKGQTQRNSSAGGYTLIFAHGTGFHKEQWEPTIEHLWEQVSASKGIDIREVWSIDCPNHGDAAILNETTLQWVYQETFRWEEYARAIYLFITGQGKGVLPDTDFSKHKLIGIGHSMGAISLLLTLTYPLPHTYSTQDVSKSLWHSLILVEPMLFPLQAGKSTGINLAKGAEGRRDIWPSKSEALAAFRQRGSFKSWDKRVLEIFCEYGLRDLPTADYPDKKEGVTLKCSKIQEAACYRDPQGPVRAYNYLHTACSIIPVHVIYGAIDDYMPAEVKEVVIAEAAGGKFASVRRVPNAGHLVVQVNPRQLAEAIFEDLVQSRVSSEGNLKLEWAVSKL